VGSFLRAGAVVLLGIALAACSSSSPPDLFVNLKTDLRTPQDFAAVRTTVTRVTGGMEVGRVSVPGFELTGDLLDGVRIAELRNLRAGQIMVRVELLDASGTTLIARRVVVPLDDDVILTVVITRSCVGIAYPNNGDDPAATECLGDRCVPPECSPETPEACGAAECSADADCMAVACASVTCAAGACLAVADDSRCDTTSGERCDRAAGCTSECSDAACNDGNPCTDDGCGADGCENVPNTAPCEDTVFCNGADTCSDGACTVHEGDPCEAPTHCEESMTTCVGCTETADCPMRIDGPWGTCAGFVGVCGEDGMQSRSVTTFACVATACERTDNPEMGACTRMTAGDACGPGGATCAAGACSCPGGGASETATPTAPTPSVWACRAHRAPARWAGAAAPAARPRRSRRAPTHSAHP
jgi:hypothetical protein